MFLHVCDKVCNERVNVFELVCHLGFPHMFVVAFATFIVVSHNSPTITYQDETIFEFVR